MTLSRRTYSAILTGAALWCGLIALAPVLASNSGPAQDVSGFIYSFFHRICHQLDERSLHLDGHPLAVCARCLAIYVGFLSGTVLYPFVRDLSESGTPSRAFLMVATLPMVIDVATGLFGIHEPTLLTRMLSGAFFGVFIPFFAIPTAIHGLLELRDRGSQQSFHTLRG